MKNIALIMAVVVVALLGTLLIILEKKKTDIRKMVMICIMTAMSVMGRIVFAAVPGFKPVTAIVVICGMYLGAEAGFLCGALSALLSNVYFGQGPWTPFQMLAWGIIGMVAALVACGLKRSKILLCIYGVFAGVFFSVFMDVYTVVWTLGHWNWAVYVSMLVAALPFTIEYAVSNVLFLLAIAIPFEGKLKRIELKIYS